MGKAFTFLLKGGSTLSIIRDQVHLIKTEDLTGPQIKTTSGKVYLSRDALDSQDEIIDIVKTVQAVKSPFYGSPIPETYTISSAPGAVIDDDVIIFTPDGNVSYRLLAVTLENIAPAGVVITGDLYLSDGSTKVLLASSGSISPGTEGGFDLAKWSPLYFSSSLYLVGVPTSGVAANASFKVAWCKVVQ